MCLFFETSRKRNKLVNKCHPLSLIVLLNLVLITTVIAQKERDKGIEFYQKGEYQSAIKSLVSATKTDKKDGEAWNILGLSYVKLSKFKESRKALENAAKQNPKNPVYQINLAYACLLSNKLSQAEKEIQKAIALDSKNATAFYIRGLVSLWNGKFDNAILDAEQALGLDKTLGVFYTLKSNSYLYKFGQEIVRSRKPSKSIELLQKSFEALEPCLKDCEKDSIKTTIQNDLEGLKVFYEYFSKRDDDFFNSLNPVPSKKAASPTPIPTPNPNVVSLSIISKPRANYTDSARQAGVQGIITLAVLFSADGITKKVLVIKPLSNGLTEEAIIAAQKITFKSQMKDGKPVSVVRMVQYTFTLY